MANIIMNKVSNSPRLLKVQKPNKFITKEFSRRVSSRMINCFEMFRPYFLFNIKTEEVN
jgi:hypothetical protein